VTSEIYPAGDQQQPASAGGIIIMASAALAALLLIGALIYSTGIGQRHLAALAAADCEPNLSPSGQQCTTVQMLTSEYLAIEHPASQQLTADVSAYTANERDNLAAAKAALAAEVTAERTFDTSMANFPFPPSVVPTAKAMVQADQALASLTARQAGSSSLTRVRSFDHRVRVATAAVETEMKLLRKALSVPPTPAEG
jgi:hypothetical protein